MRGGVLSLLWRWTSLQVRRGSACVADGLVSRAVLSDSLTASATLGSALTATATLADGVPECP